MTYQGCREILPIVPLLMLLSVSGSVAGAVRMPWSLMATVTQVLDGVTIEVEYQGKREDVRYLGLQPPSLAPQTPGVTVSQQEAVAANRRLVEGKTVRLEFESSQRDREGHVLAYVYVEDLMVNAELLRQGYAQVATARPSLKYQPWFLTLQHEARQAKRGAWGHLPGE